MSRAFRDRQKERRDRSYWPDLKQEQDRSGHGRRNTYQHWLCRCPLCTKANREHGRKYRQTGSTK